MKSYNYKCIVTKNGKKMFYKNVGGKWKRITNKLGENVEKGKRKYSMRNPFKSKPQGALVYPEDKPGYEITDEEIGRIKPIYEKGLCIKHNTKELCRKSKACIWSRGECIPRGSRQLKVVLTGEETGDVSDCPLDRRLGRVPSNTPKELYMNSTNRKRITRGVDFAKTLSTMPNIIDVLKDTCPVEYPYIGKTDEGNWCCFETYKEAAKNPIEKEETGKLTESDVLDLLFE